MLVNFGILMHPINVHFGVPQLELRSRNHLYVGTLVAYHFHVLVCMTWLMVNNTVEPRVAAINVRSRG